MSKQALFAVVFLFLTLLGRAETAQTWKGTAKIDFNGTSTLHDWGGSVECEPFATTVELDDSGKPKRIKASVNLQAAKMDTANAKRDEKMRAAMRVAEFPLIVAAIEAAADRIAPDGQTPVTLPLTLDLLGRQQKINARISNWKNDRSNASFILEFAVSLKESGIHVPSVLYMIRVGDEVRVRATVTLSNQS